MRKPTRSILIALFALAVVYLLLLIPGGTVEPTGAALAKPFAWNQDALWDSLESRFVAARTLDSATTDHQLSISLGEIDSLLQEISSETISPDSPATYAIEAAFFNCAPLVAASGQDVARFLTLYVKMRHEIKRQSISWDLTTESARDRLYRLLYGGRAAVEEILLQVSPESIPPTLFCHDEPSATPSNQILGVTIHSGDMLVSRGGAPTSALIARGSDYPGNFSHVALVYVDSVTKKISVIEAHIEKGVAIATLDDYFKDTKLRVMVLRLRSDLPALVNDPMLPHEAASLALKNATEHHIPYDFAMDYSDPSKLFCSEVASAPYHQLGIDLWMKISHISSPGVRNWLSAFGVRNFQTEEPSDLEYDPQLAVVAEWRDPETLWKDHLDNAVIDVMLESADSGRTLSYNRFMLPVPRVMKAYSVVLNWCGEIGPIPEGMSAEAALRNRQLSGEHEAIKARLAELAEEFKTTEGYRPPYWELVKLAREARDEVY